jgi:hypothetical protein
VIEDSPVLLLSMVIQSELLERIKNAYENNPGCQRIKKQLKEEKAKKFFSER